MVLEHLSDALSVAEAFAGATVLLTGATGFVGSLLLEQLLRVAPVVNRVLILVRPRRGRCPNERRSQLLNGGLFHRLWQHPDLLEKVEVVEGDLLQPGCGLSKADQQRLQSVQVLLHAAASVTFTEHIFSSLASNYQATAELADIAAGLPQLRAFVHVSTAYVNGFLPPGSRVEERFYDARCEGQSIQHAAFVQRVFSMSVRKAAAFVGGLAFPNSYCLSKWLAEQLLAERWRAGLPITIVRPAIIGAVAGAPYPGYVGNRTGATGAALAIAHGMWMFSQHSARSILDLVPGDTVSSAILLAAAATVQAPVRPGQEPLIAHVAASASSAPLCTGQFYQEVRRYFNVHPPRHRLRLGSSLPRKVLIVNSPTAAAVLEVLVELKFRLIAGALWLTGNIALASRVFQAWQAVKVFNQKRLQFDLRFETTRMQALAARLPAAERPAVWPLWQPRGANDWTRYMCTYMAGAATLCLRQPPPETGGVDGVCGDFEFIPRRDQLLSAAGSSGKA